MAAEEVMEEISAKQGWTPETQLDLALQYISNQADDDAFRDFLRQQADDENDEAGELFGG